MFEELFSNKTSYDTIHFRFCFILHLQKERNRHFQTVPKILCDLSVLPQNVQVFLIGKHPVPAGIVCLNEDSFFLQPFHCAGYCAE